MMPFYKFKAEHGIKVMLLTHKFALQMALIICCSVMGCVSILGVFFGATTPISLGVLSIFVIIFGLISFGVTRSACID